MSDPDRIYEVDIEPEEGWHLNSGETWRGYRIRYRPQGTRRWSKFLLVDQAQRPSIEQLQRLCHAHFTKAIS